MRTTGTRLRATFLSRPGAISATASVRRVSRSTSSSGGRQFRSCKACLETAFACHSEVYKHALAGRLIPAQQFPRPERAPAFEASAGEITAARIDPAFKLVDRK